MICIQIKFQYGPDMNFYDYLKNTHDLTLSDWGPYARDFFSLSHIADYNKGLRLDFFMVPGLYRRKFCPPETLRESEYAPWETSTDFSYYSYRQQIENKDKFFADISYSRLTDNFRLGRVKFVNNTDEKNVAVLLSYARIAPRDQVVPVLPDAAVWLDALDYKHLEFSYFRPDRNLTFSGGRRAEQLYHGTVGNRCIGQPFYDRTLPCFGEKAGDYVVWEHNYSTENGQILLRCCLEDKQKLKLKVDHNSIAALIEVTGSGKFTLVSIYEGKITPGTLKITSLGSPDGIRIDGLVFLPVKDNYTIDFPYLKEICPLNISCIEDGRSAILSTGELNRHYMIWHSEKAASEREYRVDDLPKLINYSHGLKQPFYKASLFSTPQGGEHCKEFYFIPISVPPRSSKILYSIYGEGKQDLLLNEFSQIDSSEKSLENYYNKARAGAVNYSVFPEGEKYKFSQQLMSATLMSNINFPIQTKGENIKHHVPDKYFNSLYSWDSGFIGLGLLEMDKTRAIENLNVYVTEPGDEENAFLLYGTPVPVQAYLYAEIWNRFQDKEMLAFFYPRLRQFYSFLTGKHGSSTYRSMKTDLLCSWDYFYNSGGWDDYPAQWQIYLDKRYEITPVVTTSHVIRFAKFLRYAAESLNSDSDIASYDKDIQDFTLALQKYSWDRDAKTFSYVVHNKNGEFKEFFRHPESGVNYNLGMDGASPLLAGVCNEEQEASLFDKLSSPKSMWSTIGLSTVDQSAPYYKTNGYWNGSVWMPYQWFFWKAALDHDRRDFARKIAMTALDLWKREVDDSYYCFEHFSLESGRGCMCHHFGGLSSPVLNWFNAYFCKQRLTGGFDLWVMSQKISSDGTIDADVRIAGITGKYAAFLYVCGPGNWTVTYNGKIISSVENICGCLEFSLPKNTAGNLKIIAQNRKY